MKMKNEKKIKKQKKIKEKSNFGEIIFLNKKISDKIKKKEKAISAIKCKKCKQQDRKFQNALVLLGSFINLLTIGEFKSIIWRGFWCDAKLLCF